MMTRFQGFLALALLAFGMPGVCWGAQGKNLPPHPAPQNDVRPGIGQLLQRTTGPVKLVLKDHTKVKGRVAHTSADSITLHTFDGDKIVDRTIRFDQVKKFSYLYPGHPNLQLIAGNVVGSGILTLIILAAVGAL